MQSKKCRRANDENEHHGIWSRHAWTKNSEISQRIRNDEILKFMGPVVVHMAAHLRMPVSGIIVPPPRVLEFTEVALLDFNQIPATKADKWAWTISRLNKFHLGSGVTIRQANSAADLAQHLATQRDFFLAAAVPGFCEEIHGLPELDEAWVA